MKQKKILIVGGVAGGATAAARIRRLDEHCKIIMFERGEHISFANCGLPYYIGGEIRDRSALTVQTPLSFHQRFHVDVRNYNEVIAIDKEAKTVQVRDHQSGNVYTEGYDQLILSMGAEPIRPPIEGIDSDKVFTLRNIPDTQRIKDFIEQKKPRTAAVVGGGYIGVEMAENLHAAGLSVTLVEMQNQLIAPLDYDMACDVHRYIESQGVTLLLEHAVRAIRETPEGLSVDLGNKALQVDMLIMAIGVKPETGIAKEAGIETNERGAIIVSDDMRTSDPDIYAVGDAIEVVDFVTKQKAIIPLAGPANKQGRIAADNICGGNSRYGGTQGTAILKVFDMTVATTGINEKKAKLLSLDYDKSFVYPPNHANYYPGAVNLSIKTIFERGTGKILGAQILGFDGTDKRCDVFASAIRLGATASDLIELELCYAPPYSSAKDPVNMAGLVIENMRSGRAKSFHWHDVDALPRDGSVTLLDISTPLEFENNHLDGFLNIPLDQLRARLDELSREKPVYVTCQMGMRSYVASCILNQRGYECYYLNGGHRLYNSIYSSHAAALGTAGACLGIPLPPPDDDGPSGGPEVAADPGAANMIFVDACGLQCPGPIVKLSSAVAGAATGDVIEISTTDPAFASDIAGYCRRTGNAFLGMESRKGISTARIQKSDPTAEEQQVTAHNGKNFIVFSGDLDKAIASFIMANASAALGRKTSMFFTFWGLNILRSPEKVGVKKDFISKTFGAMMPRGSRKLPLSKMNMGGIGPKMIRSLMKQKNVDSLEALIKQAQESGVELLACAMSMDIMGIKEEELIPGVKMAGATAMLAHAEESDMSLFI